MDNYLLLAMKTFLLLLLYMFIHSHTTIIHTHTAVDFSLYIIVFATFVLTGFYIIT